jgi:hypothetical protein
MGDLTRRNKPTPVEARRREPEQVVIEVPGTAPPVAPASPPPGGQSQPQQPANVTQNIFYISAPPGQQQQAPLQSPPAQPAPPQEVHYHTTVHHAPRSSGPRRGLSFFGSVAIVLGGLACAAGYLPQAAMFAKPLAIAGLAAGGVGLLGAIFLGRSGKAVPFLGLLVSAVAFGLWLQKNDPRVRAEVDKLKQSVPQLDVVTSNKGAEPSAKATPPAPKTVEPPKKDTSVFNFDGSTGTSAPAQPKTSQPRPIVSASPADIEAAKANLETARLAAAKNLGIDYATVKSADDQAAADLTKARATYAPGSAELLAAGQRKLDADTMLASVQQRLRRDAAVVTAEQVLRTAQGERAPRP